jgi:hypothetical protein
MNRTLIRALCGLLIVAVSGVTEPLLAQQSSTQDQQAPASQNSMQPPVELPDSPGAAPRPEAAPATPAAPQSNAPPQPSGTAVAPAVQVSGSAGSKPTGVAIAPPKQRQIRSWLIKFGFLAGAGAALGTVAALSAASPGRVPNSPGH